MKLRDYQVDCVEAVTDSPHRANLVTMATGLGKSVVKAHLVKRTLEGGRRAMVFVHREKLVRQLADTIEEVTGITPDIEMAGEKADEGMYRSPIVVATVQTLNAGKGKKRFQKFDPSRFDLYIDETHRARAKSYQNVINHFMSDPYTRLTGFTATPDRSDRRSLGMVFDHVAYQMDIRDGIEQGWLVPIRSQIVTIADLDFSHIKKVRGDLSESQLAEIMEREGPVQEIAAGVLSEAVGKTLLFGVRVAHAQMLADVIKRSGQDAQVIHGGTPDADRGYIYDGFEDGVFKYLCNVDVCTEGYDEPSIQTVAIARNTLSRARFVQMVGRGTRPLSGTVDGLRTADERKAAIAQSGKPSVKVLLFSGHSSAHRLVCPTDILAPSDADQRVIDRAREINERPNVKEVNVDDALVLAAKEIAEEDERERKRRMRNLVAKATTSLDDIDLFGNLKVVPTIDNSHVKPQHIKVLSKGGVPDDVIYNMDPAVAAKLSREIVRRWKKGLCSYKQAKLLKRYGMDTERTFEEASAIIDAIAANGWTKPRWMGA